MVNKKALPSWRDNIKPHKDIMENKFDLSLFAVNIYKVYQGKAPPDYQDPVRFFAKTYMTKALKSVVASVHRRLEGQNNSEPILDLMTSFGGGKTHTLLALYHIASNGEKSRRWSGIDEIAKEAKIKQIPTAKIAVLSGEDFDPAQGEGDGNKEPKRQTLWGELAWQLGGKRGYDLVKENDMIKSAPTANIISKLLELNPANLILIDEALRFVSRSRAIPVHESSLGAQTLNFFRSLTEAVSTSPKTALVATLQASVLEMPKEDEPDYMRILEIFKRVGHPVRLAEGDEIYEIVKRRLFQEPDDPDVIRRVADAYYDFYQEHKDSFPNAASSPSYLEKLVKAYPFHPEFLDILNERWSSIPHFQRTRAILRMLAMLVAQLYKNDSNPLIQVSSTQLSNRDFRTEVLQQLHAESQFDTVIESDIAGTGARAQKIDQSGNLTYQREHIAESVATAIFLYSFGGSAGRPSALISNLCLAVLKPSLEPAFVPDALQLLKKPSTGLFYIEQEGETYRFTVTPNINMILAEREAAADHDVVNTVALEAIQKQIGSSKFRVVPFPDEARDVADQPQLTLVIMHPKDIYGGQNRLSSKEKISSIVKGESSFRTYRNCVIFSVPEENHKIKESARTLIALRDIERLYAKAGKLSEHQKSQLSYMVQDSEKTLSQSIWRGYRYIMTPSEGDALETLDMGVQIQKTDRKISDAIWEFLVTKERLAPQIGPSRLISKDIRVWPSDKNAISTKEMRNAFLTFTYLPMIPSDYVLKETISQGVSKGIFGCAISSDGKNFQSVRIGSGISPEEIEFGEETFLLQSRFAHELVGTVQPPTPPISGGSGHAGGEELKPKPGAQVAYRVVTISADMDWKKWVEFYDGVIQPLVNAGTRIKINVELTASSETGIPKNTIDLVIKENLSQYGIIARIEPKSPD